MSQAVLGAGGRLNQVDFGRSEVMESKSKQAKPRAISETHREAARDRGFHQAVILQGAFYGTEKRFCHCAECPCPAVEL